MDNTKMIIEDAEKELAELKVIFEPIQDKMRETGGPKCQSWLFYTRHKIYKLEEKIKDLKANIKRTDKIPVKGTELEKRISNLEASLGKLAKKGK